MRVCCCAIDTHKSLVERTGHCLNGMLLFVVWILLFHDGLFLMLSLINYLRIHRPRQFLRLFPTCFCGKVWEGLAEIRYYQNKWCLNLCHGPKIREEVPVWFVECGKVVQGRFFLIASFPSRFSCCNHRKFVGRTTFEKMIILFL